MQYRRLGRTNHNVSVIGFGGGSISGQGGGYSFGNMTDIQAIELIHYAREKGINLFDTAPIYGKGLSEQRLGTALHDIREEVFIVSKCGITWKSSGRIDHHNDPVICYKMLEQSLRDLQSDYIDLYMVHFPDPKVDIRRTVEILAQAQQEGKVRFIGLCNTNQKELTLAQQVANIDAIQNEFNFFQTKETEQLFSILEEWDIGLMGWGTLHKGILTGRATSTRQYGPDDVRSWAPWFRKDKKIKGQIQWAHHTLLPQLKEQKINPTTFALQFSLSFAPLASALCGFRSKQQLDDLIQGIELTIAWPVFQKFQNAYQNSN